MGEIRCDVQGVPRVRVADASRNHGGFERRLTRKLHRALLAAGVQVDNAPFFPGSLREVQDVLTRPGSFNCLLLITHGEWKPWHLRFWDWLRALFGRAVAKKVLVGGDLVPWEYLASLEGHLAEKLVLLAVCGAYSEDAIWTFAESQHFCLMLLASPQSVTVGEVLAFFPPFLQDLSQFAKADAARISPESVQASLGSNNHLANRKFVLYSAVGIATGA